MNQSSINWGRKCEFPFYSVPLLIYGFLLIGSSGEILSVLVYEWDQMYVLLRSKNNQLQTEAEHRILVEIRATKSSFLLILTILEDHNLPIFQISFCTISFWNCKLQSTRASLCPSFVLLKDINKPLHKKKEKKGAERKASIIWTCLGK